MSIIVKAPEKKFTPAPEGLHPAVCIDAIERKNVQTQFGVKDQIELRWEIEEINEETGRPFQVRAWYTASLHEKAKLRLTLAGERRRPMMPVTAVIVSALVIISLASLLLAWCLCAVAGRCDEQWDTRDRALRAIGDADRRLQAHAIPASDDPERAL